VILSEHTTNSIVHMSTASRIPAILQEADVMNNARAVDEPLHSSKRGDATRFAKCTNSTGFLGFRPRHRHYLAMSTCRTFSLDGRDPLSLERARTPLHDEATGAVQVLGCLTCSSPFTGAQRCISYL
jgi:hypothetical protein